MKRISVIGAGFYGSTLAMRLAEYNIFSDVILTDIVEGKAEGLALDINQSRSIEGFETEVVGVTTSEIGYEVIADSDIVMVTAGLPRKPGMSRMDLIEVNAKIIREVSENISIYAPDAVVIVVSNPLDEMTALTQMVTGFDHCKVIGQAGMLDSARFAHFIAQRLQVKVSDCKTLTLGSHGETMVPVPSVCTVKGKPLTELLSEKDIEELVTRTRNGGAEVVALLKTGSAYFAPSAAAARMAKAVAEDSGDIMPVCAWVNNEFDGIAGTYLGVQAELCKTGVRNVVTTDLTSKEFALLHEACEAVRGKQKDVEHL